MDTSNDIKKRYAKEVFTYRRDAWLVNVDAERLFDVFKIIIRKLFNNQDDDLDVFPNFQRPSLGTNYDLSKEFNNFQAH